MNAIVKQDSSVPAITNESATILSVISRAAADPNCDIEKMERLLQMQERVQARQAQAAFAADLAEMQDELPSIGERGDAAGRYTYALWEDINAAIKPVLKKHGFALSFRTDFSEGIAVTGVLSHRSGHSEQTTIRLPADASGNKNAVQAVASSVSYGKRYTAGALLNLTSHGEDDDAFTAVVPRISEEQVAQIQDMLESTGANKAAFLRAYKINAVHELSKKAFADAMSKLKAKERQK